MVELGQAVACFAFLSFVFLDFVKKN